MKLKATIQYEYKNNKIKNELKNKMNYEIISY